MTGFLTLWASPDQYISTKECVNLFYNRIINRLMSCKTLVSSVAYPTIGVILLGGISDKVNRMPLHTSAGIAYTGIDTEIETRTTLCLSHDRQFGLFNGSEISVEPTSRSPFYVIKNYEAEIRRRLGLDSGYISYKSENINILSGSSDSGAAALGVAVSNLASINPYTEEFENSLRRISESVGRSLYGGLTLTHVESGRVWTENLLGPEAFENVVILGFRFNVTRNPSDAIHENIVNHPEYPTRKEETRQKGERLKRLARSRSIRDIFDMAAEDTDRYHSLIEAVGVRVRTDRMNALVKKVRELKESFWLSYIITGGSNVFVTVERETEAEVIKAAQGMHDGLVRLRVAGKAAVRAES
ncbi:MAG TPA: diphosphomevalonate decarboxylase [Thermoplasmataceae archaeon]|nr:diphosphomevalonate decarboxylase [Thermoplasmataceae archaeon]